MQGKERYLEIKKYLQDHNVELVLVSKTKPVEMIKYFYGLGQKDFGENRVQEMRAKQELLPRDIRWHQIGHLQKNKVKYIAPFVYLIHSVDSLELLKEIDKRAKKHNRVIDVLLQIKIAAEDTKFGMSRDETTALLESDEYPGLANINITGLMGMATFTPDENQIRKEFRSLKAFFDSLKSTYFANQPSFSRLSMGMSSDYKIAVEEGATMVRIGSLIMGSR